MKLKLTVILVLVGLMVTGVGLALAETNSTSDEIQVLNKEIAARKDKIKQLEDTIVKYNKNINEQQTKAISLRNQLSILDNYVAQIKTDVELTQEKIKATELEIQALELNIKEKQDTISRQKNIIAKIVQNLHQQDQRNYLEIMLSYSNFADFYDELKYVENVYVDLGRSIKSVRLAKEDMDIKKQQLEGKRLAYQKLKEELENKRESLVEQADAKQDLLIQTKSSEAKYRTLLASLKQQYQVIESEVRTFEERVRKKLEDADKIQSSGSVAMSWPVSGRYITAGFHDPSYPFRNVFEHSGVDIRAGQGTPVKAAAAGYVARARRCTLASCYAYVLIVHTGSVSSLYGHLSSITVADDQFVNRGDIIGYSGGMPGTVGAGPFVTGPHMHFEVRLNGIPVDPMGYLVQ